MKKLIVFPLIKLSKKTLKIKKKTIKELNNIFKISNQNNFYKKLF